jgi:two-component system chemotaxis response regulator CheY
MFKQDKPKQNPVIDRRARLFPLRVLLADQDQRTADLVRRVLYNFGFRKIDVVLNADDVLRLLRTYRYELLICESRLRGGDGKSVIKKIRSMKDNKRVRRDVPIIMLTADSDADHVRLARDAGINEFVKKPFNAKTLSERIIQVIDFPRIFVDAEEYAGPCRRRRGPAPPETGERRSPPPSLALRLKSAVSGLVTASETATPTVLPSVTLTEANDDLKQAIGMDIRASDILTDAVVQEAQAELKNAEAEFISWARDDIASLEEAYAKLVANTDDRDAYRLLVASAYAIKSQAGIFGYDLGTEVSGMLVKYLTLHPELDAKNMLVIRKHIDTIGAIFTQKIKDAGPEIAQDFMRTLELLIQKLG